MPTTVIPEGRLACFVQPLEPGQDLTVEWVREADWDAHWAVVFNGASGCRQEVRRLASYSEARAMIEGHLARAAARGRNRVPA